MDLLASRGYFVANCVEEWRDDTMVPLAEEGEFDVWEIALGDRPVDG